MNGSTAFRMQGISRQCRRMVALMLALTLGAGLSACHRKTTEEQIKEAFELYQGKDTFAAELKYQKILDSKPDEQAAMAAHYGLAQCYQSDNDFEHEREQLDFLLKAGASPNFINFLNMKVESYIREKKPAKAIETTLATSATLHGAPNEVCQQVQLMLAQLYQLNNQDEKTTQTCLQLIRDFPENFPLHNAALTVMVQKYNYKGEFAKTVGIYEDYLKTHPKTQLRAEVLYDIAFGQKKLNQTDKANANFDAAEKEIRNDLATAMGVEAKSGLTLSLARVQLGRGNLDQGRATLRQMLKDFPKSQARLQAQRTLAQMAIDSGVPGEAVEFLKQIVAENPDTQDAYNAANAIQRIQSGALQTTATLARAAAGATTGTAAALRTTSQTAAAAPKTSATAGKKQ